MMENDDKLIKNFMLAYKHEIEDNGFSRQVIRRPFPENFTSVADNKKRMRIKLTHN